jgi:hypothetical protein
LRARLTLLLAFCALVMGVILPVAAQTSQEEVKATFVYRFVSFVTWPPAADEELAAPIRLCVVGADPFARTLQRIVARQRAGERAFEVRRLAGAADAEGCHAIYVVGDRAAEVLRAARRRPVLTITDSVSGGDRGIIHFALVEDRVRFYIDDANAAESGLGVDPRLLNLALSVRRRASS